MLLLIFSLLLACNQKTANDESHTTVKNDTEAGNTYNIGLNASLSGAEAISGEAILLGLQMAVEGINKSGGLLGKQVRIITKDDKTNTIVGKSNAEELIKQENPIAIFGGKHTPVVLSYLKILNENSVPLMISWASGTAITNNSLKPNNVFRLSINDKDVSRIIAKKAIEKASRVSILSTDSSWGVANSDNVTNHLRDMGFPPVSKVMFLRNNETKFKEIMAELTESNPDLIIYFGKAGELVQFLTEMQKQDKFIPIISHWGITGSIYNDALLELAQKTNIQYLDTIASSAFEMDAFQTEFKNCTQCKWDFDKSPLLPATIQTYDLAGMLFESIKQSGHTDGRSVISSMENIESYNGLMGDFKYPFNNKTHDALRESDYILKSLSR